MKFNKWTLALAAAGVVSFGSVAQAEEAQSHVMTALSQTTLSGYVETSAIWRPGTSAGPGQDIPGRTFDGGDRTDSFNLHAVKLTLEKPLDEGQWSAGYKADLVFGPDASYYGTKTFGGVADGGDFNIKQAYVALRAPIGNGLDFKVGVWDTLIGYEVFESGNNPNFSRSYGFALEPTHHTGILASYHINDMISVSGGVANTYVSPINSRVQDTGGAESQKTYVGSVTVTMPESTGFLAGSTLYLGIVDGRGLGNTQDTTSYYAGYTMNTPLKGLALGLAFDYRDDGMILTGNDNWAWAGALYLSYQATEKLKFNARADYTEGSNGTYFASTEKHNEIGSLTGTIDYSLWANVITRAEVRWDHSFNDADPFNGDEENALTVAANIIYKF